MQRWGKTAAGTVRFFCPQCKKTSTRKRKDVTKRHRQYEMEKWLEGKQTLKDLSSRYHRTRQTLWKDFHPFFNLNSEPVIPSDLKIKRLILDGTYIHSHSLCALVAIDEFDRVFWRFAPYESFKVWYLFLSRFPKPEVVVMDGQKGLFAAAKYLWPDVKVQRCQFHVVSFTMQYLGRRPRDEAAKTLLSILYELKYVKTYSDKEKWILLLRAWEYHNGDKLNERNEIGRFQYPRLRSARLIIRRALPYVFTFLDYPGTPTTTNLVEGWVNAAIAEAIRLHRGLRAYEKKTLVSVILSQLSRGRSQKLDLTTKEDVKKTN